MKDFTKMTLAVIVGIIIASILSVVLSFGLLGAIGAAGKSTPSIPKEGVLKIDLSKFSLAEQSVEANPFDEIQGKSVTSIGILDACKAIETAATDPAVKFIYIKADQNVSDLSHLEEFRNAVKGFRENSGKPVIAYVESPSTVGYYFASVADKIYMTSHGGNNPMILGMSAELGYFADILKKFGVNIQLIRHGKFKSAGEPFIRSTPSEENLTQYRELLGSYWNIIGNEIAQSRGIELADLDKAINDLELCLPEDFVRAGLVDTLMTRSGMEQKITDLAMEKKFKSVDWIGFGDYVNAKKQVSKAHSKIAIIYADGEILDGYGKSDVCGDRFAKIIEKARADSSIKAVLLRVNSPGGSVLGSDKIKAELDLLKEQKPVVASFGSMAASGGYWISNNCDRIFSDATCLTGSIGVFSLIPDFSKTMSDIAHIGVFAVKTHEHSDMFSAMRPLSTAEYNYMLRSVEDIYTKFVNNVANGRNLDPDFVDSIGQGRVWTGECGVKNGLVDEIGGIYDALRYTAAIAGDEDLENWKVVGYPKTMSQMDQLLSIFNKDGEDDIEDHDIRAYVNWLKAYRNGSAAPMIARVPFTMDIR